jgi:hypothetical protein
MRIRPIMTSAASILATALLVAGCSKPPAPPPAQANPQTQNQAAQTPQGQNQAQNPGTLNSDGTQAQPQTAPPPPGQPAPGTAAAPNAPPAPAASQSAPPPPPPPPLVVPSGTHVAVRITERLSASHNEVGDPFTGVLDEPLVSHGRVVFPRGTRAAGTIVAAKGRGRFKGSGALGIELTSIAGRRVHTSEFEQEAKGRGKRSAGIIGGGAGLGAIIGGIAGGGKGAAIGGLAGAGAGTAGAAYTGNRDVVLPAESLVTFRLTEPLTR